MLKVLGTIVGLIVFLIIFAVITAGISVLSEKYLGIDFDPFDVTETDSDYMKIVKTKNNIKWATKNDNEFKDLFK